MDIMRLREELLRFGIEDPGTVHRDLSPAELYEEALRRGEGRLSRDGALVVMTAPHTGRAAKDKYFVKRPESEGEIWWQGGVRSMEPDAFRALRDRVCRSLERRELFVRAAIAGADPAHRISLRVVTETAWHSLFAENMFLPPDGVAPAFTILHAPSFRADPARDGTRSDVFIAIDLEERLALIGGTAYAGEIKKTIFTVMNWLLPGDGVLAMHCSANTALDGGNPALFFGLSGTGKTTLSTDESRMLVGDDEHGWSGDGVFNIEGGCYAKVINLSAQGEPQIFAATRSFGTVLENVVMDPATRALDLADASLTENTRASYPISAIAQASRSGRMGHPEHIVMLTCDAFGVLPAIASLSPREARRHFLAGYTARVAGTEAGVTEPRAVFSPCFGGPFLAHRPAVYAALLERKIAEHGSRVWLLNTGWQGGPHGVGSRISLKHTRALVNAALDGKLDRVPMKHDPLFGLSVPESAPDVPPSVLSPRFSWSDKAAYDEQAGKLAAMFEENVPKG